MDGAAHGGEHVGDSEGGEGGLALCDIDVRDVEVWEDFRQF